MKSSHAVLIIACLWFLAGAFYYPKWKHSYSEAAISWDVSGYYHYLPAILIYKDVRQQKWMDEINNKYLPSPAYDQAFVHKPSGNKVNKYAIGQSVLFTPFFVSAHAYTMLTDQYPSDGYSRPYQVAVWLGSLICSVIGLVLLRKILLKYFDDRTVGWTLIAIGAGTHWFEYASITNGMNHTWLFTLLCGLILSSIAFYKTASWTSAIGIGIFLGLAILTRPTEILWTLIPLLWEIHSIRERYAYLASHWKKCLLAVIITGLIMSVQSVYWKYAGGEWIIYSYEGQGFDWLRPRIWRGLMGVNIGWWTYTPMMLMAMFGWYQLYKYHRSLLWPSLIVFLLAFYVTMSWSHFQSGGGLGQRNLIQVYPLLALPLASFIAWLTRKEVGRWIWVALLSLNVYYSMWWIHQAHKGGFFQGSQTTTPYFYHVAGRMYPDRDYLKLLDTHEYFKGKPGTVKDVWVNDFEKDSLPCMQIMPDSTKAACINESSQFLGPFTIPVSPDCKEWLRVEGDFMIVTKEWDTWKQAQWIVQFHAGEKLVKSNLIKVHRLIREERKPVHIFFDVKMPKEHFDKCSMVLWNADSKETTAVDNLRASCFSE